MKSVLMHTDHNQPMTPRATRHYIAGNTYHSVLEEHARAIVEAGAGEIIPSAEGGAADQPGKNDGNPTAKARQRRRRG